MALSGRSCPVEYEISERMTSLTLPLAAPIDETNDSIACPGESCASMGTMTTSQPVRSRR